MNERIKELADEAAKFSAVMALPTGDSGDHLFVEKLAELIVKECAQFVEDEFDFMGDEIIVKEKMLKRFGVEI